MNALATNILLLVTAVVWGYCAALPLLVAAFYDRFKAFADTTQTQRRAIIVLLLAIQAFMLLTALYQFDKSAAAATWIAYISTLVMHLGPAKQFVDSVNRRD